MARDDWRIRIELEAEHAGGFLNRLGGGLGSRARDLAKELEANKLAVSRDDDTLFVYAASRSQARQAQQIVEAELEEATIEPLTVKIEHWLAEEERWDDEPKHESWEEEVLDEGYAPWEVRVECASHEEAEALADSAGAGRARSRATLALPRRRRDYGGGGTGARDAAPRDGRGGRRGRLRGDAAQPVRDLRRPRRLRSRAGYRGPAARLVMLPSAPPAECRGRTFSK